MAHVKAAFAPEAVGHRHMITSSPNFISMQTWAQILKENFANKFPNLTTEVEPGELKGKDSKMDDTRMRKVLGITATDFKSTVIDMANSLIEFGLVKP